MTVEDGETALPRASANVVNALPGVFEDIDVNKHTILYVGLR